MDDRGKRMKGELVARNSEETNGKEATNLYLFPLPRSIASFVHSVTHLSLSLLHVLSPASESYSWDKRKDMI